MGRPNLRGKITVSEKERRDLERIGRSQKEEHRRILRAKTILMNLDGLSDMEISKQLGVNRKTVMRTLEKSVSMGVCAALGDMPRIGKPQIITDDEKMLVVSLACTKPVELGYSYELWTYSLLIKHIRKCASDAGLPSLESISRSTLWRILNEAEIKPHKIRYYLERKDPEFEEKMAQVLCVYKEVEIANGIVSSAIAGNIDRITVSYDEKPGIQAIGNTGSDLSPELRKRETFKRDSEYKRYGTVSLLAGMNLHDGHITHIARDSHKSSDFIAFLEKLDAEYDKGSKIRLILDNHSAHISKETQAYLLTRKNRFEFVFTPKHGSWLNIIESFFSKMARSFLRGIRVSGKDELKARIDKYFDEINECPVVFRWKYKMDEVSV